MYLLSRPPCTASFISVPGMGFSPHDLLFHCHQQFSTRLRYEGGLHGNLICSACCGETWHPFFLSLPWKGAPSSIHISVSQWLPCGGGGMVSIYYGPQGHMLSRGSRCSRSCSVFILCIFEMCPTCQVCMGSRTRVRGRCGKDGGGWACGSQGS